MNRNFPVVAVRPLTAVILLGATLLSGVAAGLPTGADAAMPPVSTELPGSFAELVRQVTPAVVNISTVQTAPGRESSLPGLPDFQFPPGSPFEDFFKRFQQQTPRGGRNEREKSTALGSGFIVDPAGFVVTNNHVIENADEITVVLQDGTNLPAKLIGRDEKTDLALLKVNAGKPLPFLEFGDSDTAQVGDWVIAIGNPFGLGGSVTTGIISARSRDIQAGPYDDFLQLDASINRGNSGGPTFDVRGRVIGINTAIYSPNGGSVGIGFAIPSNMAKRVIAQLRENGSVSRGWLGVQIQPVTPEIADGLGMKQPRGALVAAVTPNSPAARAKVAPGDVIMAFDGKPIDTVKDLTRLVADARTGTDLKLEVLRKGRSQTLAVTLKPSPDQPTPAAARADYPSADDVLGLRLARLDKAARRSLGLPDGIEGVLVVDLADRGGDARIQRGDVILEVGDEPVTAPADVAAKVQEAREAGRGAVLMRIRRGDAEQFVALPVKRA
jgi:serine protease Do